MAIDLNFDEEQQLVRDTARQFLEQHSPPSLVRQYLNSDDEFPRDLWRRAAELGWLGMGLPEAYGGLGTGFMVSYALYLELGRSLAPIPHLETVALAGSLVAELGDEAQKRALLPGIAEGRLILGVGLHGADGGFGPGAIDLVARPRGAGFILDGTATLVAYAGAAHRLICAARTPGAGPGALSLFLVDPSAPGVERQRTPNIAGLPLYTMRFTEVALTAADLLGAAGGSAAALGAAVAAAGVLQSAMVVGAGERILDMTVDYAKSRVQFGEPVGRHQAVQYLITDIAMHGHNAGLLALQADWRIDTGRPFLREAALANAAASRAAAAMTFASHEVHAGIGFMADYDLQLFTRRAKHWEFNLGDPRHHLEQAAALAFNPEPRTLEPLS